MSPRPVANRLCHAVFALALLLPWIGSPAQAQLPPWRSALVMPGNSSAKLLARKQLGVFKRYLDQSLRGEGKKVFLRVSGNVRTKVAWRDEQGKNAYIDAFHRAYPHLRSVDLEGMPDIILLIPSLESRWNAVAGEPAKDYGYWQLGLPTVAEIQTLDYAPETIRDSHPDKVRSDAAMSTKAAQIHLRRYWYYFSKVANFPESDAWLLSITAYNWGSGNVKRLLAELEADGVEPSFSSFYHRLYLTQQRNPADVSMRAALEYLPNLWNIVQLVVAAK